MRILRHEWKMNLKSLLIWALCVGLSCCGCILLFESVADSMAEMAQSYADMGGFSTAFGMDKVSIATIDGFYATEVSILFSIGGAMFAAMTGAILLSKEEEGHTAEFLYTLPVSRSYILVWKYIAMFTLIVAFNAVCIGLDMLGFLGIGTGVAWQEYALAHMASFVMQIEIGSICFLISACCRKKQIGLALGISVLLYMMDIMCRIVPDLEFLKYLTPYYYANAADIFSEGAIKVGLVIVGIGVSLIAASVAEITYRKRDLAS